ncbi:DUF72 domain-containing protein [Longimicrobium terrae]|uniref:Uncharacterized protein YecE (DUF72 family) n=1 Tax=Longimicrobium terrae TaxID=1639882 RepID=A0A841GYG5_9BACT|nr:DUF72 domain-containing protein [Longimicrobium terrae]MBB4636684.1 uncharacterized protein YecE (DUF72 family) [Longimicrobium terrae]MBB6070792.1 uncharacterized protein YecE (DUF72 family) [Longimicrobium terrae]NNC28818.1 DUF72 domain-containing protein [Longimicrobium terrae]
MASRQGTGHTYVGISGWTYAGWRGVFYPQGLARRRELAWAASRMNTIEINGSFYSLQRPSSYRAWYEAVPDDFRFAVKGSRFITHLKKLKDVDDALANFLASGVLCLSHKLGPVLWQFPERMKFDEARFADFLARLPRTHAEASAIARGHDARLDGRAWTEPEHDGPIRHAFEVRHPGFLSPAFVDLLRAHNAAFVFADTAGKWPYAEDVTGDFVYVRLHGAEELYASGYRDDQLDWWAARIREWRRGRHPGDAACVAPRAPDDPAGRDVFVYFDNDAKVHAPFDALRLAERLR